MYLRVLLHVHNLYVYDVQSLITVGDQWLYVIVMDSLWDYLNLAGSSMPCVVQQNTKITYSSYTGTDPDT